MKQAFLDSLCGMKVEDAEQAVLTEGHIVEIIPENCDATVSIARPNTVILWQRGGVVRYASAGDPLELKC